LLTSAKNEEYLEAIYNMEMEGDVVIGARLAEKFKVKAPTVTEMLQRLEKAELIAMDQNRHIALTAAGVDLAEQVLRRHRLTERFLVDMLGMQWHQVHEEACRLEHYISGAVEARVLAALGQPTTCPHGNPIPGMVANARSYLTSQNARRLPQTTGETVTILCVSEVVEDEEEVVRLLHENGLTPGKLVSFQSQEADTCAVTVEGTIIYIHFDLAHALWVIPAQPQSNV
jgi:DtxR family Mn-dependent transcriptional regulator